MCKKNQVLVYGSLLFGCLLMAPKAWAQEPLNDNEIVLPEGMLHPVDSLLSEWLNEVIITGEKACTPLDVSQNPSFSDSVYIDRLSRIPTVIELPYNHVVRSLINDYTGRENLRKKVSVMLGIANFYFPMFEDALDAYGLPLELKFLPVIESALNPQAVSRVRAVGLWQFMLGTAKMVGLEVNSLVDERKDPVKSSWAAARYLQKLHSIYNDWALAIAAYNCGPGNVNKAIQRAGGKRDYWEIYPYLPRETRTYVPTYIAAIYVMNYYCEHGICPTELRMPADTDTIHIDKPLHFEQIAAFCNISIGKIRSLNPSYIRDVIPGNTGTYSLRLPIDAISRFIDKEDEIYAYNVDELFRNRRTTTVAQTSTSNRRRGSANVRGGGASAVRYKIKSGDTLSEIATRYGVTVKDLMRWNGLSNHSISAGKYLNIHP